LPDVRTFLRRNGADLCAVSPDHRHAFELDQVHVGDEQDPLVVQRCRHCGAFSDDRVARLVMGDGWGSACAHDQVDVAPRTVQPARTPPVTRRRAPGPDMGDSPLRRR
jgi:hypothetical protein